jgi:hypothetical protein
MTAFKFFKHKNGLSAFAAIALEPVAGVKDTLEWEPAAQALEKFYGEAVSNGIRDAVAWHMLEGGAATAFRVLEIVQMLMDTKPDAVRCAATMAAWKALGHAESGIAFEFDGEWKARRSLL